MDENGEREKRKRANHIFSLKKDATQIKKLKPTLGKW